MFRVFSALSLQIAAAGTAFAAITLAPPAEGVMLLVPLAGQSADSGTVWATNAGARIVGRGPIPGSIAVEGSAASLIALALRHATLVIAAPPTACGARR